MKPLQSEQMGITLMPVEMTSSPFSKFLSIENGIRDGRKAYLLKYRKEFVGNPSIEAFHGGIVSAFIEMSAQLLLYSNESLEEVREAETLTVDFLRPPVAKNGPLVAVPSIVRKGKNVSLLEVEVFQNDKLVATGKVIYLAKR